MKCNHLLNLQMWQDFLALFTRCVLHHTWDADGVTENTNLATCSRILSKYVIMSHVWLMTYVSNEFPPKPGANLLVAWFISFV